MNKQVELIKAEIERLIRYLGEQRDINLEELLSFINSLPEEPSKDLKEEFASLCPKCGELIITKE